MKAAFTLTAALVLCRLLGHVPQHPTSNCHVAGRGTTSVLCDRDCGATTGFTTQVSIADRDKAPSGSGNVFIADGGAQGRDMGWAVGRRVVGWAETFPVKV